VQLATARKESVERPYFTQQTGGLTGERVACNTPPRYQASPFSARISGVFFTTGCQTASCESVRNIAYNTLPYIFARMLLIPLLRELQTDWVGQMVIQAVGRGHDAETPGF
jgi:hypothetical protein